MRSGPQFDFGGMVMKKRWFGLVLAAALSLSLAAVSYADTEPVKERGVALNVDEGADELKSFEKSTDEAVDASQAESVLDLLPEVGEEIHGFTVTAITDFPLKKGKIISMEHEQSGAKLIYIACDQPDKAFNIYYRTSADNDKGIPHVFEHITLSGSPEYPSATLWDQISNGTYNTYMNASTWTQMTDYKMSSLSEDQLLRIMDMYMSGLTDPLALKDEHPLRREAYRFELEEPEGDITVTGAVFNEMESANANITSKLSEEVMKQLYPGSIMSANTGGYRDDIITITLDELKTYYNKFYHPSNMLIAMYGDMDCSRFLEILDNKYLSRYEKRDIRVSDDRYRPWTGFRKAVVSLPVTEDASKEGSGAVSYSISLSDLGEYDTALMEAAASLLGDENSPVKQKVREAFPNASFECGVNAEIYEPVFYFDLMDANEGNGEKLKKTITEALDEIFEKGLNKDNIKGIVNRRRMASFLMAEEPGGIDLCEAFGLRWALTGDPLAYLEDLKALDQLEEEAESGRIEELLEKYLKDPKTSVLVELVPDPGLREMIDDAFEAKLADMKAGMSISEIAELVGNTVEFKTWSDLDGKNSLLDQFRAVDVADLGEETQHADVEEKDMDGIRVLTSTVDGAGYLSTDLMLDASSLSFDEIHDAAFLGEVLGSIGTQNYTAEKLDTAINNSIFSCSFGLEIIYDKKTGTPMPYFSASHMELQEEIGAASDLMEEVLLRSEFTDTDRIRMLADVAATELGYELNYSPARTGAYVGIAASRPDTQMYEYYAFRIPYLSYLKKVAALSDEEAEQYTDRLHQVLKKLLNRDGMVISAVGSDETIEEGLSSLESLTVKFTDEERTPVDYTEDLKAFTPSQRTAVAVNDSVSYNGVYADVRKTGITRDGKWRVIVNTLYQQLFYPAFRYDIGAYGLSFAAGERAGYIQSYRDPQVSASFAYFDDAPEKVAALKLDQDAVNDSILNVYSELAYPLSPLQLAATEIARVLENNDESYGEETLRNMKEAKEVTPEDISAASKEIGLLVKEGSRTTAANMATINKNRDLYDEVIDVLVRGDNAGRDDS